VKSKVREIGSNVWRCKEWVGDGLEMVRSVQEMTGNGFG
jgi:hypothetical protein